MSANANLFRVAFKVRPLPGNPRYWDCQYGIVNVWLFADSPSAASEQAASIIDLLPYDRVGEQGAVFCNEKYDENDEADRTAKEFARRQELAKESGLSLLLIGVATGADETEFENAVLG